MSSCLVDIICWRCSHFILSLSHIGLTICSCLPQSSKLVPVNVTITHSPVEASEHEVILDHPLSITLCVQSITFCCFGLLHVSWLKFLDLSTVIFFFYMVWPNSHHTGGPIHSCPLISNPFSTLKLEGSYQNVFWSCHLPDWHTSVPPPFYKIKTQSSSYILKVLAWSGPCFHSSLTLPHFPLFSKV